MAKKQAPKKDAKKPKAVARKTVQLFRELDCELSQAEGIAKAKEAAVLFKESEKLLEDRKLAAARLKAEADDKASDARRLLREFAAGKEKRRVECSEITDWDSKSVYQVRLDTNEEIQRRPMNHEELNRELDFGAKA
jgi:hypothetical protein